VSRAQRSVEDYIQQYKTEHTSARSASVPCVQNRSFIGEAG